VIATQKQKANTANIYDVGEKLLILDIGISIIVSGIKDKRNEQKTLLELRLSKEEQKKLDDAMRQDEALKALSKGIADMVISNEEAPVPLSVVEASLDPIKAAGQDLKVEASFWDSDNNPIIAAVQAISRMVN
jgi:hypothetical protein